MGKDSFVFYLDWLDHLGLLNPADAMQVLQAVNLYIKTGQLADLDGAASMAFAFIRSQVDRDMEKWEDTRRKRSEAGKAGAKVTNGRQKAAKPANAEFAEQDPACTGKDRQKAANPAVTVPVPVPVSVSVPVPSKEGGCNKADKPPTHRRFVPPSLEEVTEYVRTRNSPVDPRGFIDFYASKGWMVGKTPMKDWKAACRNAESWERWRDTPRQNAGRGGRLVVDEHGEEVAVFD